MTDDSISLEMPKRIQLHRTEGWRKPEGAVVVSRPSKWGNPFHVRPGMNALAAVGLFKLRLVDAIKNPGKSSHTDAFREMAASLVELRGHDLACWCAPDAPCHADVLLAEANR